MKRGVVCAAVGLALACLSPSLAPAQPTAGPRFLAFAFASNDHGWAGGSEGIAVTQDGGRTWGAQFRGRRVDQLIIVRRRTLYALAEGEVLHTSNDGGTWQELAQPQLPLKAIAFPSDRDGFGIGVDGLLYGTSDGAQSWHRLAFDRRVNAVCFSDRRTGFVGGATTAPALGAFDGIAATTDGGRSWSEAARPPTGGLVGIAGHALHCTRGSVFDLVDLGAHAGGGAYILARSTDAGHVWKPIAFGGQAPPLPHVPQGPGTEATSMSAYSPDAAYIAGFCGACGAAGQSGFGATTDAGRTWENTKLDAIGFTSKPVFTTPEHGWIGARVLAKKGPIVTDEVLVTNDAGHSWSPIFTTP
jgi:photosystem II stability/assembly factor-like uncharacterized protein